MRFPYTPIRYDLPLLPSPMPRGVTWKDAREIPPAGIYPEGPLPLPSALDEWLEKMLSSMLQRNQQDSRPGSHFVVGIPLEEQRA